MATKITEFIETTERRGKGIKNDPFRLVWQLYTLDGKLIIEDDPFKKRSDKTDDNGL